MTDSTTALVGSVLRRERIRQKVSQAELESASGVPKARISRYENGHTLPTIDTLAALADGLGVKASLLLRRAGF